MLVQLLTDGENTKRGFNASFNFNPINKNCTNWLTSDKLVSPNYPKINCSWLVTASMNSIIYIEFENFQVNCHSITSITWLKSQNSHNSSHYYIVVLEWTVRCSWTVWFFVMFDMFEVRFWAKMWCLKVFEFQSGCYVTRLVLEFTVWCSRTVHVFVMFDMFEVRFRAKMWCSESSMFGHSMFGVFEVRYFGVRSKNNKCRVFLC